MSKEAVVAAAEAMYEELSVWRGQHPEASFDEIAGQVTPLRQRLMGQLLALLAEQEGQGEYLAERHCSQCGMTRQRLPPGTQWVPEPKSA